MNTRLSLSTTNESIKLLQISDMHLFADKKEKLLGVPTYKSFQAVINTIKKNNTIFDLIVCSGDITQDQSIESYQHFINIMGTFNTPVVWLPGNHDNQNNMQGILNTSNLSEAKHILINDNWQCILLDSQLSGAPKGELSGPQLDFLEKSLSSEKNRNTLIFVHHNPKPCGSQWLDQHKLQNSDTLATKLKSYDKIKAIICGHIHQAIDDCWEDWSFYSTPSTSIQFLPKSKIFSLDTINPGWREFILKPDGNLETCVKRIENINYSVDVSAKGYE
ncbi:3',5'-cyclic-AMP phosphodiesterase [Thorsellia anophelis]|uniref:Icc protein n=1 Tax=Thorsellia anophelis DSM 18579 TaxID=1123402 RepID=A0A1I0DPH8_9GAMM|nr:3',5'-cyclic-AMP phosphodiesterase [Thorsellia anophelis]SET34453.1 Icc protein [Thorsellia anophelis DSM 18579]